jgi:choline dehydrogenase-like flavoprotein
MYNLVLELQKTYPTLTPVFPPVSVLQQSNPAILEVYIKQGLSLTDHYCSTCKLGTVVDPNTFLLMGTNNIHIIDASTFASISDGNTAYPCMVMAEIASKRIGDLMEI